ncbi:MAG: SIMPL domain-containing protein [Caldilineaceae bacterium]|nr:SIMPL domain-containing protein [Caldilineaceae bacterium]
MWLEASKSIWNRRLLLSTGAIALILLTLWIATGRDSGAMTAHAQISSGITSPAAGSVARGEVPIIGTATIGNFQRYELYYKPAFAADDTYTYFDEGVNVVINGQLGIWDTRNLAPGDYTLRLRVVQNDGNYAEFFVENISVNPPVMPTAVITPFASTTDPTGLITPTADAASAQIGIGRPITGTVARTITLLGRGAASAPPNHVRVRLFIASAADPNTVGFRFASEADLQQAVLTLQATGVPLEEIRIIPFSRRPDGAAGVGEIRFLYRQPGDLSAFLSDALNRLAGNPNVRVVDMAVQFGIDNCAPLEVEAMRAAVLAARARAEPMAQVLNVGLGPVLSVSENVPSIPVSGSCLNLADQTEFMPLSADTPTEVEVAVTLAVTFVMVETPASAVAAPTPTPFLDPTPDPSQFPVPTPAPPNFHTIQFGETLDMIALQYGVTVDSILFANNLTPETAQFLQPGQALIIPQP